MRKKRFTSAFKSEFKKVSKWPSFDEKTFRNVVDALANDIPLDDRQS